MGRCEWQVRGRKASRMTPPCWVMVDGGFIDQEGNYKRRRFRGRNDDFSGSEIFCDSHGLISWVCNHEAKWRGSLLSWCFQLVGNTNSLGIITNNLYNLQIAKCCRGEDCILNEG